MQRGMGQPAAAAAATQPATFPVPPGPAAFPGGVGSPDAIMVGEPLVIRTDALVGIVNLRVCAVVVDTVDYPES